MRRKSLRAAIALAVLCVGSGLAAQGSWAAPPAQKISWSKCYATMGPFECGTLQVPLDYGEPQGATISLALVRLPAGDPANRIGSLFLNPGGPGGSGVDFTVFAGPALFTPEVRARFDLVGFDPRGIARSTAVRCFGTDRQWGPAFAPFAFPLTAEEEQIWMAADLYLVDACAQRAGRIVDHMSTANVARDLDMLRQAVGDAKLSYYGVSYGSFLGQTYANMFPGNFRALVIDGVLDPIAWVNTGGAIPFSTRLRSDAGAMATLNEFFRLCDLGGNRCAAGPQSAQRYADTLQKLLDDGPVDITFPDGSGFNATYANLIGATLGPMYDSLSWEDFAGGLAFVEGKVLGPAFGAGCAACGVSRVAARLHHEARLPALLQLRGLPRGRMLGLGQPGFVCGLARRSRRRERAVRLLRAALDVGHEHLREVGRHGRRSLHRAFQPDDGRPRSRGRKPLRSRDEIRGRGDGAQPAPELGAPDRARLGTHVALHLALRRHGHRALPDRRRDPRARDRVRAGSRALSP